MQLSLRLALFPKFGGRERRLIHAVPLEPGRPVGVDEPAHFDKRYSVDAPLAEIRVAFCVEPVVDYPVGYSFRESPAPPSDPSARNSGIRIFGCDSL